VRRDGWPCGHCCGLGRKGGVGDVEQSWRGAARGDGARGAAFGGLGRALVPRCLCVRGAWRGHRGSCGDGGRGQPQGHGRGLRRRFLEPDPLHHADGFRGHRRLCSGDRADRGAPDRSAGQGPAQRARSGGLCRPGEHAGFAAQLGVFAGVRRPAGARAGPSQRVEDGLPGRRCRGLPGPGRGLGDGPELLGRAAAGQPGLDAAGPAGNHRRAAVHRDDLPVAVDRAHRGADSGLAADLLADRAHRQRGAHGGGLR